MEVILNANNFQIITKKKWKKKNKKQRVGGVGISKQSVQ